MAATNDPPRSMSEVERERDVDEARSFSILLASFEDGQLNGDLTQAVQDMVARLHDVARDRGGSPAGAITIKLGFKLDGGVIETKSDFTVTMPKEIRPKSIFWATPQNNLTRSNPKQRDLPLSRPRDVTTAAPAGMRSVT